MAADVVALLLEVDFGGALLVVEVAGQECVPTLLNKRKKQSPDSVKKSDV